jgi:hypothetical protein
MLFNECIRHDECFWLDFLRVSKMNVEEIKKLKVAKVKCKKDTLFFVRYFFKKRFNRKFVIGEHHEKICKKLDDVYSGKTKRLIINIAPRYGKTEVAVKNFIAKGLAHNPSCKVYSS